MTVIEKSTDDGAPQSLVLNKERYKVKSMDAKFDRTNKIVNTSPNTTLKLQTYNNS